MNPPFYLKASLVLGFAIFIGRILGFIREVFLAHAFGVTSAADFAVLILALPDLMTNILISGGASIALIPAFKRSTIDQSRNLFIQSTLLVAGVFLLFSVFFMAWPKLLFGLLAPGLALGGEIGSALELSLIFGAVIMSAMTGITTATLNASNRFLVAGSGTIIFNLCAIIFLWFGFHSTSSVTFLAVGILVGAVMRWGSQLLSMPRIYWESFSWSWQLNAHLYRQFCYGALSTSMLVLIPVAIRSAASLIGVGEIARFNYAMKLVELPAGVLITTLSTVAYPGLCALYEEKSFSKASHHLQIYLQQAFFLALNALLVGWFFSDSIVNVLFEGHKIQGADIQIISRLLQVALVSLPFVALSSLFVTALQAQLKIRLVLILLILSFFVLLPIFIVSLMLDSRTVLISSLPIFYVVFAFTTGYCLDVNYFGKEGFLSLEFLFALGRSMLLSASLIFLWSYMGSDGVYISALVALFIFLLAITSSYRLVFLRAIK